MRYHENHHLGLSNKRLTRQMALSVSGPYSSTLGTYCSVLRLKLIEKKNLDNVKAIFNDRIWS